MNPNFKDGNPDINFQERPDLQPGRSLIQHLTELKQLIENEEEKSAIDQALQRIDHLKQKYHEIEKQLADFRAKYGLSEEDIPPQAIFDGVPARIIAEKKAWAKSPDSISRADILVSVVTEPPGLSIPYLDKDATVDPDTLCDQDNLNYLLKGKYKGFANKHLSSEVLHKLLIELGSLTPEQDTETLFETQQEPSPEDTLSHRQKKTAVLKSKIPGVHVVLIEGIIPESGNLKRFGRTRDTKYKIAKLVLDRNIIKELAQT